MPEIPGAIDMSIADKIGEQILRESVDKQNERVMKRIPLKKRKKFFRPLFAPTPSERFRRTGKRLTINNV